MAKGNQKAENSGVINETRTQVIDWQALDNSNLKPINRVGIPGNKHVGCK